ncbi:MAG: hypothetical protein ACC651_04535, partial [Candidatus Scalindua sp.]
MLSKGWIILPGNTMHWPRDVKINGRPARVVDRNGNPGLYAGAGSYKLQGDFAWETLPEFIQISSGTALVSLSLNGREIRIPNIDNHGRVWLRKRNKGEKDKINGRENRLEIRVFRRITDEIPLMQTIRIELDVSGKPRDILLGQGLPAGYIPMSLNSPLPVRIETDGRLLVQVRPGNWSLVFTCRHPGPVNTISLYPANGPWPEQEVWVFDARNHLRLVEIEGGIPIDPQQTSMPADWRNFPAYRVSPGDSLKFIEKRRGDPDPAPDRLTLQRNIWLDFSGEGYTIQDHIHGTMTQGWRLEMSPPATLGQVNVDGKGQFITRLDDSGKTGVEVRRGQIRLVADSRIEGKISNLPAVGWDHDFQQVGAVLHLPPGWRLFDASGVDDVPGTWLKKWTLLDLFVVLIISLSIFKLWGIRWGVLALIALTLFYHETFAPRFVWLHILFSVALLRVLPAGKFSRIVKLYRNFSLLALLIISVPFMVDQVRNGIFPQLEKPRDMAGRYSISDQTAMDTEKTVQSRKRAPVAEIMAKKGALYEDKLSSMYPRKKQSFQYDPKANIQTGPGLPLWKWTAIPLRWNGPVDRTQRIRMILISPPVNMILSFLRVLLLAALVSCVFDIRYQRGGGVHSSLFKSAGNSALIILILCISLFLPIPVQADYPSQKLLNQLRERLLEKPDCLPRCADSPQMYLEINQNRLRARIEIHSLEYTAVPLPGSAEQWLPNRVLLNGNPARGLFKTKAGQIWIELPEGLHQILMEGPLPNRSTVQISLPLKPHRVEAKLKGWILEGLHENGLVDNNLQLTRVYDKTEKKEVPVLETGTLPPFVRVERNLLLGLDWQVETQLVRMTPVGQAVVLEVPLLEGESVTSEYIRVVDGKALINMAPNTKEVRWSSVFEKKNSITLTAPDTVSWTEVWRINISPIWHVVLSGISVVHHQSQNQWLPEWRPWPGESVTIKVSRPEGVSGKTLTVDSTQLTVTPGQRATNTKIEMTIRSSQGRQQTLKLPEDARLQFVSINGVQQSIRQEGESVTLPLVPGSQNIELLFQQPGSIRQFFRTPKINLGVESVNARIQLNIPHIRWVLFTGGPNLGPAVLFWGVVLVVILISIGLGRIKSTPLK